MKKYVLLLFLVTIVFYACTEKLIVSENSNDFTGYWINQEVNDTIFSFQRSASLADGQYCFGLLPDGTFVERKNAGWCGTPPVMYGDYEGEWSNEDSLIYISVPYWGGIAHYTWKMVSIDDDLLSFSIIDSEYDQTIEP